MVGPGLATCARRSSSTSSTRSRSHGRIWRLRYDGRPAVPATRHRTSASRRFRPIAPDFAPPRMYSETPAQLVAHLTHPNGWWRDTAQRLLDAEAGQVGRAGAAADGARRRTTLVARFHALWTLEGLGALDAAPGPRRR